MSILLDGIDTTTAWRVEAERPVMESTLDWLVEEAMEEVVAIEERVQEKEEQ